MSATQPMLQKDELQDSWVDIHYQNNGNGSPRKTEQPENVGMYTTLNIEKLLSDAQRESNNTSREASARGSPKSLHSPTNELAIGIQEERQEVGTDWIWDWSSGPERNPTGDMSFKFRHPAMKKRHKYSMRNTAVLKSHSLFSLENLPTLLLTHACSFVFGAAVMLIYLKKYRR